MKRKLFMPLIAVLLAMTGLGFGQNPVTSSFEETIALAPPTVSNAQTYSNTVATGSSQTATGGTVAAGAYRVCVSLFTAANTETPCSVDTAASSVITTTGATSTITIQPPSLANGAGANIVGYRVYIGANGGAAAAETLQTLTSTVCVLSTSATASCALTSPAVFTASTNFTGGSGGVATPGTAIYPPVANSANTAFYENSLYTYRVVNWVVSGTAPSACTLNFQTGTTIAGLANVTSGNGGQTVTCTASGTFALPSSATTTYSAINLATYTPADTTTKLTVYYSLLPFNPVGEFYYGNAAPTSTCPVGSLYENTVGTVSITLYTCTTGTWTAVTVP